MKKNTFKRVLAGSLALLTVASPMTANVGGFLQEIAIVASAVDTRDFTVNWSSAELGRYLESIQVGDNVASTTYGSTDNYKFHKVGDGAIATITSEVPLTKSIAGKLTKKTPKKTADEFIADVYTAEWTVSNDSGSHAEWFTRATYDELSQELQDEIASVETGSFWDGWLNDGHQNTIFNGGAQVYDAAIVGTEAYQFAMDRNQAAIGYAVDYVNENCGDDEFFRAKKYDELSSDQKTIIDSAYGEWTAVDENNTFEYEYTDVTDKQKADSTYQLQPGEFTVTETRNGAGNDQNYTWTYKVALKDDQTSLSLKADTSAVSFEYDANSVSAKTSLSDFGVTYSGINDNGLATSNNNPSFGTTGLAKDSEVVFVAPTCFQVKALTNNNKNVVYTSSAAYDKVNKVFTATIKVPNTDEATFKVIATYPAKYTYTNTAQNFLMASGGDLEEDSIAASITASAYRAETRDIDNGPLDAEVDIENFEYNGRLAYGEGADDGVTIKVSRDSTLTAYADNSDNRETMVLTIYKDNEVWAGINEVKFTGGADGNSWTLMSDGSTVYDQENDWNYDSNNHWYYKENTVDGKTTGSMKLTAQDLTALVNGNGNFKFTESGSYRVEAKFFTTNYGSGTSTSTIGTLQHELNYCFNIVPYTITAQDLTIQLYTMEGGQKQYFTEITPKAVSFDKDGNVEITVPKKYENTTFNVEIVPNQNAKKYPQFKDFQLVATAADIPSNLGEGFDKFYVEGTTIATELNKSYTATLYIYDQNWGATLSDTNGNKPKAFDLTYTLKAAAATPEISMVLDPEDIVNPDQASSSDSQGSFLRIAQADTDRFAEIFWNNYEGNDFVQEHKNDIQFAYVPTMGQSFEDDFAVTNPGFPTEVDPDGYTLLALYDGVAFFSCNVKVVTHKATLKVNADALNITYGSRFDPSNYSLVDENGNVIPGISLESLVVESIYYADDEDKAQQSGRRNGVKPYKQGDGTFAVGGFVDNSTIGVTKVVDPDEPENVSYDYTAAILNAGTYVVNYDVDTAVDADFTVSVPQDILKVNKKKLEKSMFYMEDLESNGKAQPLNPVKFRWVTKDEDGNIINTFENANAVAAGYPEYDSGVVTIHDFADAGLIGVRKTQGADTVSGFGKYELTVEANEAAYNDYGANTTTFFTGNFTGSVTVDYYVTAPTNDSRYQNMDEVDPGFKWDAENTSMRDGGRLRLNYSMNHPDQQNLPDGVTLVGYGVAICKSDQCAAPTSDGETPLTTQEYEAQKANPGQGGIYTEDLLEVKKQLMYKGINQLTAGGNSYGNGFNEGYWEIETELQSSNASRVEMVKDYKYGMNCAVQDVQTGIYILAFSKYSNGVVKYDQYPVYVNLENEATRILNMNLNPDTMMDGKKFHAGYDEDINRYRAYATYKQLDTAVFDDLVSQFFVVFDREGKFDEYGVSTTDGKTLVTDGLKLNKGYGQGYKSKSSEAILKGEQYGVTITPGKTDPGSWVRLGVNLGKSRAAGADPNAKDLIIYSKPEYYESVAKYHSAAEGKRGAITVEEDENAVLSLNDLNPTAVENGDDARHNKRNTACMKPSTVKTTYNPNSEMYSYTFNSTITNTTPNYQFVRKGVIVSDDESLIQRVKGDVYGANSITVYNLREKAASELIFENDGKNGIYVEYDPNDNGKNANYKLQRASASGKNKIQVVRAFEQYSVTGPTGQQSIVTIYGDITMNWHGNPIHPFSTYIVNGVVREMV